MSVKPDNLEQGKQVDIEWWLPDELQAVYANQLIVQHSPAEFTLTFAVIEQPVLTGTPEERMSQLATIDSVRARCVARVYINPNRMQLFINALQENLNLYRARTSESVEE